MDPAQKVEFLGYVLDSVDMSVSLPHRKCVRIRELGLRLLPCAQVRLRDLASFIGTVVAAEHAVPMAALRYKYLEIVRNVGLSVNKGCYDAFITLQPRAKADIQWWLDHINSLSKSLIVPPVEFEMTTDASNLGWGARLGDAVAKG